jgi:hypothetical protein
MSEEIRLLKNYINQNVINGIKYNQFGNVERLVSPSLNPGNRRKGGVDETWFHKTFISSPMKYAYLVANNNNTPNEFKRVVGLAALNNYNTGRVLHALVTNKGKGMPMMKRIIANAIANNKNYINLNAVPNVEGFYRHRNLGFINRKGNTNNAKNAGLIPLTKWLRTNRPNNRVGNNASPRASPRASGGIGKYTKKFTAAHKLKAKRALENNTPSVRGGLGKFTKKFTAAHKLEAKRALGNNTTNARNKAAMRRKVKMASVKYATARQNAAKLLRVTRSGRVVKPPRR